MKEFTLFFVNCLTSCYIRPRQKVVSRSIYTEKMSRGWFFFVFTSGKDMFIISACYQQLAIVTQLLSKVFKVWWCFFCNVSTYLQLFNINVIFRCIDALSCIRHQYLCYVSWTLLRIQHGFEKGIVVLGLEHYCRIKWPVCFATFFLCGSLEEYSKYRKVRNIWFSSYETGGIAKINPSHTFYWQLCQSCKVFF